MSKTTIALTNSVHNTSVNVRVLEGQETKLEKQTIYRIRNTLCNVEGCDKCNGYLNQAGESNPLIEERDGDIYILYKMDKAIEMKKDEDGEVHLKKVKMSDSDKAEKEHDTNYIHFTVLEAKIMTKGTLTKDETEKLFNIIREIRNGEREVEGLNPI